MTDSSPYSIPARVTDNCPDCGVVPGAFHTAICGARDSGQQIWPGTHFVPVLAAQIRELRDQLGQALARIHDLEAQTPQAQRLQHEADLAAADLAESGYHDDNYPAPIGADRHGGSCQCPYCYDESARVAGKSAPPPPPSLRHPSLAATATATSRLSDI